MRKLYDGVGGALENSGAAVEECGVYTDKFRQRQATLLSQEHRAHNNDTNNCEA